MIQSRADRITPLPPHITRVSVSRRVWDGVCVDVTEFWGHGEGSHSLAYESEVRLTGLLEEVGGHCEPRLRPGKRCPVDYAPHHMHFAPAGLTVWGYSPDIHYLKDATMIFEVAALERRLEARVSPDAVATPRIRFTDEALWMVLKLLADAANDPDPSAQLYGDGLIVAAIARLFLPRGESATGRRSGLSPWQLRRVEEFFAAQLPRPVALAELAALTGLSQAHFARAFKASTGRAPYRYQLERRIEQAKARMLDPEASLEDVAAATGFVDAAHLGRVFRNLVGASPGAWRRGRIG